MGAHSLKNVNVHVESGHILSWQNESFWKKNCGCWSEQAGGWMGIVVAVLMIAQTNKKCLKFFLVHST